MIWKSRCILPDIFIKCLIRRRHLFHWTISNITFRCSVCKQCLATRANIGRRRIIAFCDGCVEPTVQPIVVKEPFDIFWNVTNHLKVNRTSIIIGANIIFIQCGCQKMKCKSTERDIAFHSRINNFFIWSWMLLNSLPRNRADYK